MSGDACHVLPLTNRKLWAVANRLNWQQKIRLIHFECDWERVRPITFQVSSGPSSLFKHFFPNGWKKASSGFEKRSVCSVYPESGRFSVFTCRNGPESANRTSGTLRIRETGRVIVPPGDFTHHRSAQCPAVKLISEAEVDLQPPPDRVYRPLNGSNAGWSGDATDQQEFRSLRRIKKEKKTKKLWSVWTKSSESDSVL